MIISVRGKPSRAHKHVPRDLRFLRKLATWRRKRVVVIGIATTLYRRPSSAVSLAVAPLQRMRGVLFVSDDVTAIPRPDQTTHVVVVAQLNNCKNVPATLRRTATEWRKWLMTMTDPTVGLAVSMPSCPPLCPSPSSSSSSINYRHPSLAAAGDESVFIFRHVNCLVS